MNFTDLIAQQAAENHHAEDIKRIRAHSLLRCARLQISDAAVIAAFADKAAEFREAGNDPEPCLQMAYQLIKEIA